MKTNSVLIVFGLLVASAFLPVVGFAQSVSPSQTTQLKKNYEARILQLEERFQRSRDDVAQLMAERDKNLGNLQKLNVTEASFAEVMRLLQTQRVQLTIDLAGLNARKDAVLELREETKSENGEQKDLLKQIVEEMENNLSIAEKQYKQGIAPMTEFQKARVAWIEARLRLTEAEKEETASQDAEFLSKITIERAELQARLRTIEELLGQYYKARRSIDQLQQLEKQYEISLMQRIDTENELKQTRMELELLNQID